MVIHLNLWNSFITCLWENLESNLTHEQNSPLGVGGLRQETYKDEYVFPKIHYLVKLIWTSIEFCVLFTHWLKFKYFAGGYKKQLKHHIIGFK